MKTNIANDIVNELMRDVYIKAYYTTRGKCNPDEPYSGFNICHYTGDSRAHIEECRKALATEFNMPDENIIVPRQTHSANVATITSLPALSEAIENVDALVTNLSGIIIGVNTADCVPVIMTDSSAGIVAVVHAGWRGAIGGIVENALNAMISIGAETLRIKAVMGPSICQKCFEVGEEVAARFSENCVDRTSWEKPHISLHRHIKETLIKLGVPGNSIGSFDDTICTKCHPDMFYSARHLGVNSGRVFTFATIL